MCSSMDARCAPRAACLEIVQRPRAHRAFTIWQISSGSAGIPAFLREERRVRVTAIEDSIDASCSIFLTSGVEEQLHDESINQFLILDFDLRLVGPCRAPGINIMNQES